MRIVTLGGLPIRAYSAVQEKEAAWLGGMPPATPSRRISTRVRRWFDIAEILQVSKHSGRVLVGSQSTLLNARLRLPTCSTNTVRDSTLAQEFEKYPKSESIACHQEVGGWQGATEAYFSATSLDDLVSPHLDCSRICSGENIAAVAGRCTGSLI
jgi:hypothetical protein